MTPNDTAQSALDEMRADITAHDGSGAAKRVEWCSAAEIDGDRAHCDYVAARDRRIAELRSTIVSAINSLPGSFAAPEVTDGFLAYLPDEIKGQIAERDRRIAELTTERDSARQVALENAAKHCDAQAAVREWIACNAHGGWIDDLRVAVRELRAALKRLHATVKVHECEYSVCCPICALVAKYAAPEEAKP